MKIAKDTTNAIQSTQNGISNGTVRFTRSKIINIDAAAYVCLCIRCNRLMPGTTAENFFCKYVGTIDAIIMKNN